MFKCKLKLYILIILLIICTLGNIYIWNASKANHLKNNKIFIAQLKEELGGGQLEENWGLGTNQTEYISNDRTYEWYIDQADTGIHSNENCGPATVAMASKWSNELFNKNAEDARNTYKNEGGWWYTTDIVNYLDKYNIKNIVMHNTGSELLKEQLKEGNILILCIDTTYLKFNGKEEDRVGRFYNYQGGHFIVIKGYRVVNNKLFFEAYDSNNWHNSYKNGQPKGKDRYYISEELLTSMNKWWDYIIVIFDNNKKDKISGGGSNEVKIDKIEIKYGK